MPTNSQELETIPNQYWIDMYESLIRLEKNPDFKKIIMDGYIVSKALDSVSMLAVESVKKNNQRVNVMEDLVAISNLQAFFRMISNLGRDALQDIELEEEAEENGK